MNSTNKLTVNEAYRVLLIVTTPKLSEKATKYFEEKHIPIHYKLGAVGTAPSEILDILGIGTPDKHIIITMLSRKTADTALKDLYFELMFGIPGNGIAFTLPMSAATNRIMNMMRHQTSNDSNSERKDEIIMSDLKRVMIAAVINQGFSDAVMDAAKSAGAKGGTVIHGRGVTDVGAATLWGLGVQEEKEVVIIVADTESKLKIMHAISEQCGSKTEANGVIVSLPIDTVIGLGNSNN